MGFRSTFVTQDYDVEWPEWFVEKYSTSINFNDNKNGQISSLFEVKTYGAWSQLHEDIQKSIKWDKGLKNFILVYLHECGGITRCQIEKDSIKLSEPSSWEVKNEVEHFYCYGCSDVEKED